MTRSDAAERVAVVGDGQMGVVMAAILAWRGTDVVLWGPLPDSLAALARDRRSSRLPELELPDAVRVEPDPARALGEATIVVNAIPTQFVRAAWKDSARHVRTGVPVVSVTKGIEDGTLLRPSEPTTSTNLF